MTFSQIPIEEILPHLGPSIMRDVASLLAQSTLYGIYLIVFGAAVSARSIMSGPFSNALPVATSKTNSDLRHGRSKTTLIFSVNAIGMVALFTISTFLWSSNIAVLVKRVNIVFVDREASLLSRLQLANSSTELQRYMNDVMFIVAYLIGDALIVWRIIILYQRQLVIAFSMLLLWLGAATTGVGLFGCLVQAKFPESDALPRSCTNLENASWVISLALNAVGTALLARLAWVHRKSSRLISQDRYTKADRVLCTLVTAGLIYFILGLPRLTAFANQSLNPLPSNVSFATQVIAAMLDDIVGLYPTAVTAFLSHDSKIFESQTRVPSKLLFWPESTIRVEAFQITGSPETEVAKPTDDSDTWAVKPQP